MNIKPNNQWHWYFDDEYQHLMLDLDNGMVFRSHFPPKMLTADAFYAKPFCVEDAALFALYEEQCRCLSLNQEQCAELILNALVAFRFLKPLMPKSWYFKHTMQQYSPKLGEIVLTRNNDNDTIAHWLVAETGENASLCLLAQPSHAIAERQISLGSAIKIMHDRLNVVAITEKKLATGYAEAI